MIKKLRIFFLLIMLNFSFPSAYAGESWEKIYRNAEKMFQAGQFDKAIETAQKAWNEAKINFGLEDVRTYGSEMLLLTAQSYKRMMVGESAEDLMPRMMVIKDKAVTKQLKTFLMIWQYGESAKEWPDSKHIILTFVDYPNHHVGIYSPDLGEYLESLSIQQIPVVFEITYTPLGEMQSYNEIQIGDIKAWKSQWGYGGTQGDYNPSPWEASHEK